MGKIRSIPESGFMNAKTTASGPPVYFFRE
jgi:hypothetical protein